METPCYFDDDFDSGWPAPAASALVLLLPAAEEVAGAGAGTGAPGGATTAAGAAAERVTHGPTPDAQSVVHGLYMD